MAAQRPENTLGERPYPIDTGLGSARALLPPTAKMADRRGTATRLQAGPGMIGIQIDTGRPGCGKPSRIVLSLPPTRFWKDRAVWGQRHAAGDESVPSVAIRSTTLSLVINNPLMKPITMPTVSVHDDLNRLNRRWQRSATGRHFRMNRLPLPQRPTMDPTERSYLRQLLLLRSCHGEKALTPRA